MASCQHNHTKIMLFAPLRTSPLPLLRTLRPNPTRFRPNPNRFRSIPCRLTVSSSIIGSVNVIAAAASVATGSSAHGAVTSAITQVAVTAVAIASGACLSTKVDFLWPKVVEQPGAFTLDGVDVTGSPIFYDEKVQKAVSFARKAHQGQLRRTGEPYLSHCIHTGQIVSVLVPSNGKQAVDTVVAAILHDVVDDTCESLHSIEESFGSDVANLVAGVSRLSFINQLLRRHRRINVHEGNLCHEEANNLRVMLLGMVDDPRVVLIKLADRLHNMRTIYALPTSKAQAVAQETLLVWCSLASRLGLWALKAELEDLCFAVLQPEIFRQMRADLASMWASKNKAGNLRRTSTKASSHEPLNEGSCSSVCADSMAIDEDVISLRDLLEAVLPFDLLLDRGKRTNFLHNLEKYAQTNTKAKVVRDAGIALASLAICEEALERELFISTSYVPGMEVSLSSRLKSLYSIYSKMRRKDVGINKVYDARALRVIVGDKNGSLHGPAVKCCYSLLDIIHRLWPPIDGELDDYIINPKPSGYQSLHTALQGPDCSPLEVQIRTQRMHEYAEHGLAAHWLYKETASTVPSINISNDSKLKASPYLSSNVEQNCVGGDVFQKYRFLKVGHPALRVEGSHLLAAVVVRVVKGGRELLVAVSFDLASSEAVADRKSSFQFKRWEAYARLYKKVSDEWWFEPGHGDWCTCLEKYILCRDGIYHKQDQFERILPTFIQMIHLTEHEELEYRAVVSAVFEGRQVASLTSNPSHYNWPKFESNSSDSSETSINNKVRLLRTMLQWEEELYSEAGLRQTTQGGKVYGSINSNTVVFGEVVIVCLPHGEIMRLRTGSTAADAAIRVGLDGKLVLVNGQLVLPGTELKDGDVIEVRV